MAPERAAIDAELRALHGGSEAARLSLLHEQAAALMDTMEERRFQLTHAWIYGLVAGDDARTERLGKALRELGGL